LVKKGQRIIEGVNVEVSQIEKVTPIGEPSTPIEDAISKPAWTVRKFLDYIRDYLYRIAYVGVTFPQYDTYTTTPLTAGATYTSGWTDWISHGFSFISVLAYSDVAPATDGFKVQFSNDGSTVHDEVKASATGTIVARMRGRHQRVQYVNGGTNHTVFSLSRRMLMA